MASPLIPQGSHRAGGLTIAWRDVYSEIRPTTHTRQGDILIVLNCCSAGAASRESLDLSQPLDLSQAGRPQVVKHYILAATGWDSTTTVEFTRLFTRALQLLATDKMCPAAVWERVEKCLDDHNKDKKRQLQKELSTAKVNRNEARDALTGLRSDLSEGKLQFEQTQDRLRQVPITPAEKAWFKKGLRSGDFTGSMFMIAQKRVNEPAATREQVALGVTLKQKITEIEAANLILLEKLEKAEKDFKSKEKPVEDLTARLKRFKCLSQPIFHHIGD